MSTPDDPGIFAHWWELFKVIGWFIGVISALVAWAWYKMNKDIDHLEELQDEHRKTDENIHNDIFRLIREGDQARNNIKADLAKLQGEHENQHKLD